MNMYICMTRGAPAQSTLGGRPGVRGHRGLHRGALPEVGLPWLGLYTKNWGSLKRESKQVTIITDMYMCVYMSLVFKLFFQIIAHVNSSGLV